MTQPCIGITKKGDPCKASAEWGHHTCPAHRDKENEFINQDILRRVDEMNEKRLWPWQKDQ